MAGLFELQLPNESRRRRSNDVPSSHRNTARGRSRSPAPEVTAKEIVNHLVAKQQTAYTTPVSSSIFPWRRRATGGTNPSRRSHDDSSRSSVDTSVRSIPRSPDGNNLSGKLSPRRPPTGSSASPSSPRASSSIDITLSSIPSVPSVPSAKEESPSATSALVQAGLGLGFPPIAFPGSSSPVAKTSSSKRKTSGRPGTAHGNEGASMSDSSLNVHNVRRVTSFSKHEGLLDIGQSSNRPGAIVGNSGDVLVFSRERTFSAAPHAYSMPEHSSRPSALQKGKERERTSDIDVTPLHENTRRGRQATSAPSLHTGDRDKSATRRTSWWPGRRRMDSSLTNTQPPSSVPPPIPTRSSERPSSSRTNIPLLPSLRPFSPLMGDFRIPDSPSLTATHLEGSGDKLPHRPDDVAACTGQGKPVVVRRRHSSTSRTGRANLNIPSHTSSRPSSQTYSPSHRHSHSFTTDKSNLILDTLPPGPSTHLDLERPYSGSTPGSKTTPQRQRSMTISSPPVSGRETPLLLRQPINRPSFSAEPPDPFLSGWATNRGTRVSAEIPWGVTTLVVDRVDVGPTPSTSSSSTSSLSQSASTTNRPPRQRAGTTPPTSRTLTLTTTNTSSSLPPSTSSNRLLRRLSSTFFNSPSPISSPIESPATGVNSTMNTLSSLPSGTRTSPATSNRSSPGPSKENIAVPDGSRTSVDDSKQKSGKPPMKLADETPDEYLSRLVEAVSKAEVAHVLAASGDEFHIQALRSYLSRFDFKDDPLDVALRKLLMELGLPRETQQIDRVMESFAARYVTCNSGLFVDDDHPYILAFSLIMLHTDAFNKSNKNKMTKADYVKNTKLPGIPPEILECFFDNIIFAPFIFIEDPMDGKGYLPDGASRHNPVNGPLTSSTVVTNTGGNTILGKSNKIDPYYLITQNLLGPLRAEVHLHIPKSNPYLYEGTDWPWDTQRLHHLFALAQVIQVQVDAKSIPYANNGTNSTLSTPTRRKSIALPSLTVGYGPFMGSPPFSSDSPPSPPRIINVTNSQAQGVRTIRITRAGVLGRKEDTTDSGKRSTNRKWRAWSVVLTGTQLLFFRDLNFASHILGLLSTDGSTDGVQDSTQELGLLNPDEIVSLHECIAVFDKSYTKYANTFRFFMPSGRQFILQAPDESNLNDWIATINYASTFKSAGVQMRGLGMSYKDIEKTGMAAATSHLQDLHASSRATTVTTLVRNHGSSDSAWHPDPPTSRPPSSGSSPRPGNGSKLLRAFNGTSNQVDLETSVPRQLEGAQQYKATFNEVKAELAAHTTKQLYPSLSGRSRTLSVGSRPSRKQPSRPSTAGSASKSSRSDDMNHESTPRLPSRSQTLQSRVGTLDDQVNRLQRELDSELRVARNLAILTPFQRATRDRIQVAVAPLAKKIRTNRINLAKLICYRFVLLTDLAEEEREWEQAKRDALKAANKRLNAADVQQLPESDGLSQRTHIHEESTTQSFYSALDELEGNQELNAFRPVSKTDNTEFPLLPVSNSTVHLVDSAIRSPTSHTQSDPDSYMAVDGHERFYTAIETPEEIAAAWNETRAAKRVSLVRLPSDYKLPTLSRQVKHPDDIEGHERFSDNLFSAPNSSIALTEQ